MELKLFIPVLVPTLEKVSGPVPDPDYNWYGTAFQIKKFFSSKSCLFAVRSNIVGQKLSYHLLIFLLF